MATRKPNLLMIQADQLAPQFLAAYGHPLVKTPNIDRLAEQGVIFDAAYTNAPLCAPSRFVMMSGRLLSRIAAWDTAVEFSSEIPTFAHTFPQKDTGLVFPGRCILSGRINCMVLVNA